MNCVVPKLYREEAWRCTVMQCVSIVLECGWFYSLYTVVDGEDDGEKRMCNFVALSPTHDSVEHFPPFESVD